MRARVHARDPVAARRISAVAQRPRITVVGSANVDFVARCERLPRPGETLTDATFERIPGDNIRNYGAITFDGELTRELAFELGYSNAYFDYADHGGDASAPSRAQVTATVGSGPVTRPFRTRPLPVERPGRPR